MGGMIPWASVKDFKGTELKETTDHITLLGVEKSATNIIPAGNIIVPTRMALGKVAVNTVEMAINQDLKALIVKNERVLDKGYLRRFLEANAAFFEGHGKGATVKGITLDVLRKLEVPVPSLAEQKRIATILDKADVIRRKRQQTIQLADEFLRAVFLDMFGDPVANPKGWEVRPLDEYLRFLTSGSRGWAKYYSESGSKFIRIQNVSKNKLLLDDMAFVNAPEGGEAKRTKVQLGDVLLSITADLGRSAVVTDEILGGHINQHLALLRLDRERLNPRYLAAYLSSDAGVRQFKMKNKSAVKAGLNFTDIKTLEVISPPLDRQNEYQKIYEKIKVYEEKSFRSRSELNETFRSLSEKAFSGEL